MATIGELEVLLTMRGINTVSRDLNRFNRLVGRIQRSIAAFAGVAVFRTLTRNVGDAVKEFATLDGLIGQLERTTGFTGDKLNDLSSELIDLSGIMAASADELVRLGVEGARAGIRTKEGLIGIAKTASMMGNVTDLSAEQAAIALLKIAKVTQTPIDKISNIASTIVKVEKTMTTTAARITGALLRVAGSATTLEIPADKLIAIVAVLDQFAPSAQRAGTQFNRALTQMTAKTKEMGAIMGLTEVQVRDMIDTDAIDTFVLFLEKLNEKFQSNSQAADELRKIFNQVGAKAASALTGNLLDVKNALKLTQQEFKDNVELGKDYTIVMDRLDKKMKLVVDQHKLLRLALIKSNEEGLNKTVEFSRTYLSVLTDIVKEEGFLGTIRAFTSAAGLMDLIERVKQEQILFAQRRKALETGAQVVPSPVGLPGGPNMIVSGPRGQGGELLDKLPEKSAQVSVFSKKLTELKTRVFDADKAIADKLVVSFDQLTDGMGQALGQAIIFGEDFGAAMKQMLKQLAADTISFLTATIAKIIILRLLGVKGPISSTALGIGGGGSSGGGGAGGSFGGVIPLAEGGIVTKPTLAVVGEKGPEAVVPLDGSAGGIGGGTVNINADVIFLEDESAQDRFVRKIEGALVRRTRRRSGGTAISLTDR